MFLKNFIIFLTLAASFTGVNAFAEGRHAGRGEAMNGQNSMGRRGWFAELNLSAEQMSKIRDLRKSRMKDNVELREQLSQKKKALAGAIANGASDSNIKECNAQIFEVQKKMSVLHSEMLVEISKILTPEQRSKFSQRMVESQ